MPETFRFKVKTKKKNNTQTLVSNLIVIIAILLFLMKIPQIYEAFILHQFLPSKITSVIFPII